MRQLQLLRSQRIDLLPVLSFFCKFHNCFYYLLFRGLYHFVAHEPPKEQMGTLFYLFHIRVKFLFHFGDIFFLEHLCMQTAFHFSAPGPTACTLIIIDANCDCAWSAAHAAIAFFVQWMRRQMIFFHILLYINL